VLQTVLLTVAYAIILWGVVSALYRRIDRLKRKLDRIPQLELQLLRVLQTQAAASVTSPARTPVEFRSQFGEDLLLDALFDRAPTGTFIEVGAHDGYDISVTYALACRGWTGVLIEPQPERAEQCKQRRPESQVFQTALGPAGSSGTITFTVVSGAVDGDLLSYSESGSDAAKHRERLAKLKATTRSLTVPITTMDDVLSRANVTRVDCASIDVEGAELELLRGFDLTKITPAVLLIEDNTQAEPSAVDQLVRAAGYQLVGWVAVSRVYVHSSRSEILARASKFVARPPTPFFRAP
jgi:FkbM family methyltransferase